MKKMAGNKKVLVAGFLNVWATDHCINTEKVLWIVFQVCLFQPDHFGCWHYYCHLKHMILHTIIDRRDNYKYLNGQLKLDKLEEKGSPYPLYEEWLKNTTCLKTFRLKKIIYYKYYM